MRKPSYLQSAFVVSVAGTAFSGYLSAVKLFSGQCAFNEPCPYFLGYPACFYGFFMYASMAMVTAMALLGGVEVRRAARINAWVAAAGMAFALNFVLQELSRWLASTGLQYKLIFPTCAWGLVFYAVMLTLSVREARRSAG